MLTTNKYCVSFLYCLSIFTTPPIKIDIIDSQLEAFSSYKPIAECINTLENNECNEYCKAVIKPDMPDPTGFCVSVSQINDCFDFTDYIKGLYPHYLKNSMLDYDSPIAVNLISMPEELDLASLMQILLSELHSRTETKSDSDS